MDYEQARDNIDKLITWHGSHPSDGLRNEAATRLHLVDSLIRDCLGWPLAEIDPERYVQGEYSDYELGVPKRMLVEAKREGKCFELPAGLSKAVVRISTLYAANTEIQMAIQQALRYCQTRSIPIGVVANGHQLIAFLGSRQDGVLPEDGNALVFPSLQEMRNRFRQIWDMLSPAGIEARNIHSLLSDIPHTLPPKKLSARIVDYPGYKNRNPVAADLQILGGLFLEDIARQPENEQNFIRETYCDSGALSQYALVSKEILSARYLPYLEVEGQVTVRPARTRKGVDTELSSDLIAASLSQRPILLVGDVGVGKSMFIKHLVHVDAAEVLEDAVVLYLDFGTKPALARDLASYVDEEFVRQLRETYQLDVDERQFVRGVYHQEIVRFSKGIYSDLHDTEPGAYRAKEIAYLEKLMTDRDQHLRLCIQHIVRGHKRKVVIFLDNVDQRPLEFQDQVFLIAQAIASNWLATVFVALRPDTFMHSRTHGSLTGYQPRVFTIDPPRVDRVIQARLKYALEKLRTYGRLPEFPRGVNLSSKRLESYIEMLEQAFSTSDAINEFVDNNSNGNLRRALGFVSEFVGSGHVDSEKIFQIIEAQGRYTLPLHEFFRAVMFGNSVYFDPTSSPIVNVFDISTNDCREHFLMLAVLSYVERIGGIGNEDGYVSTADLYSTFQSLGFSEFQIRSTIGRATKKELLAMPRIQSDVSTDRLRIMPAGAYTARRLVGEFAYFDAMIVDTPVVKEEYRVSITPVPGIDERLIRASYFLDYLSSCWDSHLESFVDWPLIRSKMQLEIQTIRDRTQRRAPDARH